MSATDRVGNTIKLTGVDSASGVVLTTQVEVSDAASTDVVTFDKLYNEDDLELNTGSTFGDFAILFDAKDQYGNKRSAAQFNSDVIVTSSNPAVVQVGAAVANQGPNSDQLGMPLVAGSGLEGTATITVISKTTGKAAQFTVTVKKAAQLDKFDIGAPTVTVAAGDTVEIPFTAVDQYGNDLTKYSALNPFVNFTANGTGANLALVNDFVNKKAALEYTAPTTAGTYNLMAVTQTGKVSQISVEVKDARTPSVVTGTDKVVTNMVKGATNTISASNLVVTDQYGKKVSLNSTFFTNYKIVLEAADQNADKVTGFAGITAATGAGSSVTLTASSTLTGTERVKAHIVALNGAAADTDVQGSEFEFNLSVLDKSAVSDYVVEDIPTIKEDAGAGYQVPLKVYGKKGDGSKVILPSSMFTVTSTIANLTYAAGNLDANGVTGFDTAGKKSGQVIVVVNGADAAVTINKDVTVSNVASSVQTIAAASTASINVTGNVVSGAVADVDTLSEILSTLEFVDQYGEDITPAAGSMSVTFTNKSEYSTTDGSVLTLTNGTDATATIAGLVAGDSFNVTFVTSNGKTQTLKVVVTN
ncbi:hypothetical protein SAMN05428981_101226 [Bacillus sp. OV194]|nr:hypothetical protein SAMN05428981_101226 [Bacillus sp. OV194]